VPKEQIQVVVWEEEVLLLDLWDEASTSRVDLWDEVEIPFVVVVLEEAFVDAAAAAVVVVVEALVDEEIVDSVESEDYVEAERSNLDSSRRYSTDSVESIPLHLPLHPPHHYPPPPHTYPYVPLSSFLPLYPSPQSHPVLTEGQLPRSALSFSFEIRRKPVTIPTQTFHPYLQTSHHSTHLTHHLHTQTHPFYLSISLSLSLSFKTHPLPFFSFSGSFVWLGCMYVCKLMYVCMYVCMYVSLCMYVSGSRLLT